MLTLFKEWRRKKCLPYFRKKYKIKYLGETNSSSLGTKVIEAVSQITCMVVVFQIVLVMNGMLLSLTGPGGQSGSRAEKCPRDATDAAGHDTD